MFCYVGTLSDIRVIKIDDCETTINLTNTQSSSNQTKVFFFLNFFFDDMVLLILFRL
jgi:hypothetical protein